MGGERGVRGERGDVENAGVELFLPLFSLCIYLQEVGESALCCDCIETECKRRAEERQEVRSEL